MGKEAFKVPSSFLTDYPAVRSCGLKEAYWVAKGFLQWKIIQKRRVQYLVEAPCSRLGITQFSADHFSAF